MISPEFFSRVYSIILDQRTKGHDDITDKILEGLPDELSTDLFIKIENEDWVVIFNQIDKEATGFDKIKKEDVVKVLGAPTKEDRGMAAVRLKYRLYCKCIGLKPKRLSIKDDQRAAFISFYKLSWPDFCRDYDVFHADPLGYASPGIGDADLSKGALDGFEEMPSKPDAPSVIAMPKATDMAGEESDGVEDIKTTIAKLEEIVKDPKRVTQETISSLEEVLTHYGFNAWPYGRAANALSTIAKNVPAFSSIVMQSLEGVLTREGVSCLAYSSVADALSDIAKNIPILIQPTIVNILERILTSEGYGWWAYNSAADALSAIAENIPTLSSLVMQSLEGVLTREGFKTESYQYVASALSAIAKNAPTLIQPTTVNALEGMLAREGLYPSAYSCAADALSAIAIINPEFFSRAYSIMLDRRADGHSDIADKILEGLPDELDTNLFTEVRDEDWAVILNQIDKKTAGFNKIKKEDAIKVFGATTKEERAIAAVRLKDRLYREYKGLESKELDIKDDQIAAFTAFYRLSWEDFCKDYDAFHAKPLDYVSQDALKMDLSAGALDGFDGILPESGAPSVIARSGAEGDATRQSMSDGTMPTATDMAMMTLAGVKAKLKIIQRSMAKDPNLITQNDLALLENIFTDPVLDESTFGYVCASSLVGSVLTIVAKNRPDMRDEVLSFLENTLNTGGFWWHVYEASADTLVAMARSCPEFSRKVVSSIV
ncbi:MAG: hypothetical protein WC779_08250, partial [Candidatus Omnitrophota bacterium]